MAYTVDQLIQEAGKLPPFPQAANKALKLIRSQQSSAAELAGALAMDQVLASQVLRWANSAYYGMQSKIATVHQAVMLLGMNTIQELILASSVAGFLIQPVPGYDLKRGDLWRHSVGVAVGARLISKKRDLDMNEEAYFAGLLCDIGKLVFEKLLRDTDTTLPEWDQRSFLEMERSVFGLDHAMLGAEMARRWQLPENLVAAIANHHNPQNAGEYQLLASVIHVADAAMMMMGIGIGKDGLRYRLDPEALKGLYMDDQDLLPLLGQIMDQIKLAEEFIGFNWDQSKA